MKELIEFERKIRVRYTWQKKEKGSFGVLFS